MEITAKFHQKWVYFKVQSNLQLNGQFEWAISFGKID